MGAFLFGFFCFCFDSWEPYLISFLLHLFCFGSASAFTIVQSALDLDFRRGRVEAGLEIERGQKKIRPDENFGLKFYLFSIRYSIYICRLKRAKSRPSVCGVTCIYKPEKNARIILPPYQKKVI